MVTCHHCATVITDDARCGCPSFPACVDCGEPDAGSCPGGRCRECDIDHMQKWLRCAECDEPTNVNDIALRMFGWHGYHLMTCSHYLPAVRDDDAGADLGGSD